MVSISACHAEDPGSIPGGGVFQFRAPSVNGVNQKSCCHFGHIHVKQACVCSLETTKNRCLPDFCEYPQACEACRTAYSLKFRRTQEKQGGVVCLLFSRGWCITFWPSIPPLQVAPSVTCSVASLSRCPGLQLPRSCSLRHKISTDHLLGWGEPSTCGLHTSC